MPVGPPPTSHFHILSDTPSGLQPVNPPRTAQPSAAKNLIDMDKKPAGGLPGTGAAAAANNFGLKLDQYGRKSGSAAMKNKAIRDWTEQETLLLLEGLELYKVKRSSKDPFEYGQDLKGSSGIFPGRLEQSVRACRHPDARRVHPPLPPSPDRGPILRRR